MPLYEFAITVSGIDPFEEGKLDELYESGFSDATISSCAGRIIFDFSKEAPSMSEAVIEAVLLLASIGATVVEIEEEIGLDPDLVRSQLVEGNRMAEEAFRRHRLNQDQSPENDKAGSSPATDIDVRKLAAAAQELDPEAFEDAPFGYSPSILVQRRRTNAIAKARMVIKAYLGDDVAGGIA